MTKTHRSSEAESAEAAETFHKELLDFIKARGGTQIARKREVWEPLLSRPTFSYPREAITVLAALLPDVPVRRLRNAGKVLEELSAEDTLGKVTSNGELVGWLIPATDAEKHIDALLTSHRVRGGEPAPIEPVDIPELVGDEPLSESIVDARREERT